ncbi:MAG: DEAD/DEAH box helicase family protein, partial [Candidatus Nanoperiomorbaceae bacterium]
MLEHNQLGDGASSSAHKIKSYKTVYPQIYSYTLPDEHENDGSQKIGYTERKNVDTRLYEQTNTPAKHLRYEKQWSASAFFKNSTDDFKDKDFHKFLIKSGIKNRLDLGTEWFYFDGTPERSKQLFDTFREERFAALQNGASQKTPYTLKKEQKEAVEKAKQYFDAHENAEFLWNAKPRFGKTLATYDLAKQLNAKKVLVVTNRPAIANSWFDDFDKFIDGYYFISETSSLSDRPSITREQYDVIDGLDKPQITFLSLQDLKGSKYFGGPHDKLRWVADLDWDLLVVDEAHEGVDTGRTDAAFTSVKRKSTLYLSGTPFKALANNKFPADAIYNWTYLDEQLEKQKELAEGESGDHVDLPDLRLYTYRISQMTAKEVNEGIEIDDETRDYAFDLNEFFATKNQKFVHENDVQAFLRNLTTNEKYPFSTPELRDELRHTFWYVGNRVESVKALEQLLKQDPVFRDYKVIVAAGDGKTFDEESEDFRGNEKSFDKVKRAIIENRKTITLSCGQLTTGVTIKEWSAVLMLTDIKTPAQYMQAAFRAQNPYRFTENGETKAKQSAYLFDFSPTRVLEIYDKFANALNPKAVNGEITEDERKNNIKELLNFFPVISEDINGQMIELDAEKVLTFPNALAAAEIVKLRFMTNLLFNDNIKGVFSVPRQIEDIINKMPVEKNKRAETAKKELNLDEARTAENQKQTKINDNTAVILGEKVYRNNIGRVVDNALDEQTPDETIDTLSDKVIELAEPVIAKYKEVYKANNTEIDQARKDTTEKIRLAVDEYNSAEIKNPELLKQSLTNAIEHDFVQVKVEQQETEAVETIQKTKEDEIREHLRAFTRTIPMFVMANASRDKITIDNFDTEISDADFLDLTNITKDEFHMLRDGFDYEENGERKRFGGVFEKYRFNASIAEFVAEKQKRADYFKTDADIFELIPNQKNNQIFTPQKVVTMMIDNLEKESPELFKRTDSTFIDLYMKSGMYITEIVKKLFANTRQNYSSDEECVKHILENQVYGLSPTGILHSITNNYIF